ncbi:MAG: cytochrome c biogenesis protein CcsA [Aestuariibaculum sp.]
MQNKLAKILFSTRLMAILFVAFAAAMAIGTFLDAGQETSPTPYSRNLIYNTWWFELIMLLFFVNFVGNIVRYKLYKKEKWATLTLHLSFVFILLGAFVTRYIGFEGSIAIREGATENKFLSRDTYVTVYIDGDYEINGVPQRLPLERKVDFSPRLKKNTFKINTKYNQQPVTIELEKFIGGAEEDIIPNENGEEYLKMVEAGGAGPHNHFLKVGQVQSIHNVLFALNNPTKGAVNITYKDGGLTIQSPFEGEYLTMATMAKGTLVKDSIQPLVLRSRYVIGNMQMVFPKPIVKGVFDVVQKAEILKNSEDGAIFKVTTGGETQRVGVLGGQGMNNAFKQVKIGGLDFAFKYGSKVLELPFSIKLNDFEAERYPGTEKGFSAFSSQVTVQDEQEGSFDYKIYMNHILNHRGYRFFQSGFDPDEKGTILTVNHDYWGALFTYIGYFLLYFGLLAILFVKGSRFADLRRMLKKVKDKKTKWIAIIVLCFGLNAFPQAHSHSENDGHNHNLPTKVQVDSVLKANITPKAEADKFGHMVMQDLSGRMMPVNTFASELLRKISKQDTYEGFSANQVFLSMQESPLLWYNIPVIYLRPMETDSLRTLIGVNKEDKYFSLSQFFNDNGSYKLAPYLEEAYSMAVPNGYQKKLKEADQRVNLLYNTIEGASLKIFPIPNDDNNKWISTSDYKFEHHKIKDSLYGNFIKNGFSTYLFSLNQAKKTGDFTQATTLLEAFKKTQHRYGDSVMLSDKKVKTEILYNKYDVFKNLFSWYMYAGSILFILLIVQIFKEKNKRLNIVITILKWIIVGLFLLHTIGLIARWYISGHAPWSDAYESMIYVAWATMLFGLIFGKKSDLTFASTAFVTSIILMVAHWNWMDPAIANLQPVLNSYWLMIHVAVIVASYGPFTLGMILGLVALFLMIFTTEKNKKKLNLSIQELTIINEMALTVGLALLTIGNFLGGMWANESWGRYWGWDPKETWALISIMVYAFVIHMRLVPGLRGRWIYNLMSIIAFGSIMMTYFGVNFYLAGLHSYASGDQIVSVKFIAIACVIIAVIGALAYRGYAKHYKK